MKRILAWLILLALPASIAAIGVFAPSPWSNMAMIALGVALILAGLIWAAGTLFL